MQLMPETLREYRVRNAFDPTSTSTPARAISARCSIAIRSTRRWRPTTPARGGDPAWRDSPYPETRSYVSRVLGTLGQAAPALR
jgi:soluble lytic murein transglycosylase-like protein